MANTCSSINIYNQSYDIVDANALHESDFNQLSINGTNGISAEILTDKINVGIDFNTIKEISLFDLAGDGLKVNDDKFVVTGGGMTSVYTDKTITGDGSSNSPLGVSAAPMVAWNTANSKYYRPVPFGNTSNSASYKQNAAYTGSLVYNNNFTYNPGEGVLHTNVFSGNLSGTSTNSNKINNMSISIVDSLPSQLDANTLYFV